MPDDVKWFDPTPFTPLEREIIVTAINLYGDGEHPVPTRDNLHYFAQDYVLECLGKSGEHPKLGWLQKSAILNLMVRAAH